MRGQHFLIGISLYENDQTLQCVVDVLWLLALLAGGWRNHLWHHIGTARAHLADALACGQRELSTRSNCLSSWHQRNSVWLISSRSIFCFWCSSFGWMLGYHPGNPGFDTWCPLLVWCKQNVYGLAHISKSSRREVEQESPVFHPQLHQWKWGGKSQSSGSSSATSVSLAQGKWGRKAWSSGSSSAT